jgi:hypothetical protein
MRRSKKINFREKISEVGRKPEKHAVARVEGGWL